MAITNAQQYQQLVNKPAGNKRPGYRGDKAYGDESGSEQARSFSKATSRSGTFGGAPTQTREEKAGRTQGDAFRRSEQDYRTSVAQSTPKKDKDKDKNNFLDIINPFSKKRRKFNYNLFTPNMFGIRDKVIANRQEYIDKLIEAGIDEKDIPTSLYNKKDLAEFGVEGAYNFKPTVLVGDKGNQSKGAGYLKNLQTYPEFQAYDKGSPGMLYSGNVGGLEKFVSEYEINPDGTRGKPLKYGYREERGGGDGMSDYERRLLALEQSMSPKTEPEVDPDSLEGMLANRVAYRFMADGGMTNDAPVEGGIMDLESGRQMYFLGKLVKKATRAVKKIVKSPIGKAALAFGAYKFGPGIGNFLKEKALNFGLYEAGKGLTGKGMLGLAGALTAAPLLFQEEEEEPDFMNNRGPGLDIDYIRRNPYQTMGSSYRFFAEGGDVEPVAKKTMPLLDMDGQEMDLREDGGFVPIGRMERADDVPARLSKNEFVFTADAVRNAGEGDIDKGAEVMYNMMKNLESGGEVSEESQGLDGAREMFQTSKRLEEVL